jgi:RNA polymerase sigma-70 factor (ECF subfamily)
MAELTEMQRAVVTLYYFQDQSVMDVATVLGIPTGTVKTHLSRARATLKERLESMERTPR